MTVSPVSVQICPICTRRSWLPRFGDEAMTYASAGMRVLKDGLISIFPGGIARVELPILTL